MSINTVPVKLRKDSIKSSIYMGTYTGARVYPWSLESNEGVKPYIGFKFSPWRYKQGETPESQFKKTQVKGMLDVGFGLTKKWSYFTLEATKLLSQEFDVFLSTQNESILNYLPGWMISFGCNLSIETTGKASNEINTELNKQLSLNNSKGFFLGIGPSSAFPIGDSQDPNGEFAFLDDRSFPTIFPDMSVGYHFTKFDAILAFSGRKMTQRRSAYTYTQTINRNSLVLEGYKFLFDYHGFVPFVGGGIGYEVIELQEESLSSLDPTSNMYTETPVYLVFGWDIRPSEKGDWWLLRTNLRLPPQLAVQHDEQTWSLKHLEFNFIQFVLYPQRKKLANQLQLKQ